MVRSTPSKKAQRLRVSQPEIALLTPAALRHRREDARAARGHKIAAALLIWFIRIEAERGSVRDKLMARR